MAPREAASAASGSPQVRQHRTSPLRPTRKTRNHSRTHLTNTHTLTHQVDTATSKANDPISPSRSLHKNREIEWRKLDHNLQRTNQMNQGSRNENKNKFGQEKLEVPGVALTAKAIPIEHDRVR